MRARSAHSTRCALGLVLTLALSSSAAAQGGDVATDDVAPPSAPPPATMPEALPPLDDELLDLFEPTEPTALSALPRSVTLLGDGRLRFELDESRDRLPANDLQLGLSLTGRVGVVAPVDGHRATLIIGDGRRIGQDFGTLPLPIVEPMALGFLYAAHLDVDVSGLFVPARLALGRMEVQVADGRWVGRAPFDPRGRTFDGARLSHQGDLLRAQAGAFWLGPLVPGDVAPPSALGILEVAREVELYEVSTYLLSHRDGTPARVGDPSLTLLTLGARTTLRGFGAQLQLGADGQLPSSDDAPLAAAGFGAHVEGALRYGPALELFARSGVPFVELSAEWTGGSPVQGRTFRAPGASVHRFLGALDTAVADNVMSAALGVGLATDDGLLITAEARALALSDPTGALYDPTGRALIPADPRREARYALTEVDVHARIPVGASASVEGEYAVGFPGPAFGGGSTPMQRLLLSVAFSIDSSR